MKSFDKAVISPSLTLPLVCDDFINLCLSPQLPPVIFHLILADMLIKRIKFLRRLRFAWSDEAYFGLSWLVILEWKWLYWWCLSMSPSIQVILFSKFNTKQISIAEISRIGKNARGTRPALRWPLCVFQAWHARLTIWLSSFSISSIDIK